MPPIDRMLVVDAARSMIDTPFAHQGRTPGLALDCAGLLICVARSLGLIAPDFDVSGYSRRPDGNSLRTYCDLYMAPIASADLLGFGDVVLVAWRNGLPQHLGIVAPYVHSGLSMVHAESRRHQRVIETRLLFGQAMRLVAAYRIPGVA
jgi:cell wall-associated NlpC family hydrolase